MTNKTNKAKGKKKNRLVKLAALAVTAAAATAAILHKLRRGGAVPTDQLLDMQRAGAAMVAAGSEAKYEFASTGAGYVVALAVSAIGEALLTGAALRLGPRAGPGPSNPVPAPAVVMKTAEAVAVTAGVVASQLTNRRSRVSIASSPDVQQGWRAIQAQLRHVARTRGARGMLAPEAGAGVFVAAGQAVRQAVPRGFQNWGMYGYGAS